MGHFTWICGQKSLILNSYGIPSNLYITARRTCWEFKCNARETDVIRSTKFEIFHANSFLFWGGLDKYNEIVQIVESKN